MIRQKSPYLTIFSTEFSVALFGLNTNFITQVMEQARKIREQRREDGSAEADAAKFKASMSTPKVNKVEVMAGESIDTFLAKKVSF